MKKVLIVLSLIVIVGAAGWFLWRYFSGNNNTSTTSTEVAKTVRKNKPFVWGVTTRAFALVPNFQPKVFSEQIYKAKKLNLDYVRVTWEPGGVLNGKEDPLAVNNAIINEILDTDMRPYIMINQKGDMTRSADPYTDGYNLAYSIAKEEVGRVDYYQLENEITSWSLKGAEFSGDKIDHYNLAKAEKICQWLKGASAGVKAGDPAAKTVISGQWTQYAFLQIMAEKQVMYDIIGWDWFSDMGQMKDNKLADGTNILDRLNSFNKPVMLVEVGQRPDKDGTEFKMNEDKQAQFIGDMAEL